MKPTVLYELRVLNGEQRGASSAVRPGDLLRIGQDWSNDVVLQGAADGAARLVLTDEGALALNVDGGACALDGAPLPLGEQTPLALYTPFTVGDTQIMASDGMGSGHASFQGISLALSPANAADAKRYFDALADGGKVQIPLTKTFFSQAFGMVADRFGVPWMVVAPE